MRLNRVSYFPFLTLCRLFCDTFTTPITVWYHQTIYPITQIKWCLIYFDDVNEQVKENFQRVQNIGEENARFSTRLCEFFAINQNEDF